MHKIFFNCNFKFNFSHLQYIILIPRTKNVEAIAAEVFKLVKTTEIKLAKIIVRETENQ